MREQVRADKTSRATETKDDGVDQAPETKDSDVDRQDVLDETDALLAEIDEALGENLEQAQQFVASFVQKGGE